jgi:DNA-binding MarR family transcriptional regulator
MSIETQGVDAPVMNRDILDALTSLVKQAGAVGQSIAGAFGIAPHDLLAMFKLDGPLPMKELAQRMGCDASFITSIADELEKRGFVRREPGQRDRRVKNLVLTPEGQAAKERLMAQLAAKMPWCYALDEAEQSCFLGLLRKMLDAPRPTVTESPAGDACYPLLPQGGPAGADVENF